jgi:hypothetical protein
MLVLFIGTQFSNLYTPVDTASKDSVGLCVKLMIFTQYILRGCE